MAEALNAPERFVKRVSTSSGHYSPAGHSGARPGPSAQCGVVRRGEARAGILDREALLDEVEHFARG